MYLSTPCLSITFQLRPLLQPHESSLRTRAFLVLSARRRLPVVVVREWLVDSSWLARSLVRERQRSLLDAVMRCYAPAAVGRSETRSSYSNCATVHLSIRN